MLLGQARGKVGSLVFSRANGKQITRSRAEQVKNPQTLAQTIQRTFLNTASQAYSIAQAIVDHSFEGKAKGQECMSAFMKANLEYLRARVAELVNAGNSMDEIYNFCPIGRSGLFPGAWIVSKGQLPKVGTTLVPYTTIGSSKAELAIPANTYGDILAKYNLRRGDQLTFVSVEVPLDSEQPYFNFARVILDPRNEDGTAAELTEAFIDGNSINKPNSKNEGNFGALAFNTNKVVWSLSTGDVAAAGVIVSRYENDAWKRSSCQLVVQEDVMMMTNCFSLAEALSAASGMSIDTINELYLNNAGVGGMQSTTSGGGSNPSQQSPTASNTVTFNIAGATATQDVSGGSVSGTGQLRSIVVTGVKLDELDIKLSETNSAAAGVAFAYSEGNTKATWSTYKGAGTYYVFKNDVLWFTITLAAGDDDE